MARHYHERFDPRPGPPRVYVAVLHEDGTAEDGFGYESLAELEAELARRGRREHEHDWFLPADEYSQAICRTCLQRAGGWGQ